MSDPNEAVENLRLDGGRTDALAESLRHVLTPDTYEWLRAQAIAETKRDRHVRARADSEIMKSELGYPANVRISIVTTLHYDGIITDFTTRLVLGTGFDKQLSEKADAHEKWIRASPARLAKCLARFGQIDLT